jgi:hypothetical protein
MMQLWDEPNWRHIGFTGTRDGMTALQRMQVGNLLRGMGDHLVLHHGDCVGSDEEMHQLFKDLKSQGRVVVHPPDSNTLRAHCEGDECYEPAPYLDRDYKIVDVSYMLIATPREAEEVQRSGTWTTIRYARSKRIKRRIVKPNGSITRED